MITATTRLLDALRATNGDCTDYRAGKLLGVSTSAVSRWRLGQSHMNMANVSKACEIAAVPEQTWEWQIRIGAEREKGPDGDIYREALKDLESYQEKGELSPNGLFSLLRRASHAALILIALMMGLELSGAGKQAVSAPLVDSGSFAKNVYYGKSMVEGLETPSPPIPPTLVLHPVPRRPGSRNGARKRWNPSPPNIEIVRE